MSKHIVITSGFPAAGKSTLVNKYIKDGYYNLNRDDSGKSISELHAQVEGVMQLNEKVILDNTYITAQHRAEVIAIAKKIGAKITVLRLNTTIEESQFNACWRTELGGRHVPATALFAAKKSFEKISPTEGFDEIIDVPFKRVMPAEYTNKALILDYDNTIRTTKSGAKYPSDPADVVAIPGVSAKLKEFKDAGYLLLGASNQSFVGKGELPEATCIECFERTNQLLDADIDYLFCPDAAFPIKSYDRKPLPGMGVKHVVKYKLDPSKCIYVGDATTDKTFAFRCGFKFVHADDLLSLRP